VDNLTYLMAAYFHEDWSLHQETWQDVVDEFVHDDPIRVRAVPDEIDALLCASATIEDLDERLMELGCAYDPTEGSRAWLAAVRDRIRVDG